MFRHWFLAAMGLAFAVGCRFGEYENETVDLRHSDECLLVVFEGGVPHQQIESFEDEFVKLAEPGTTGEWTFREGLISAIRRRVPRHEAYEYCFAPEADAALRATIRGEIEGAPIVLRVETVVID